MLSVVVSAQVTSETILIGDPESKVIRVLNGISDHECGYTTHREIDNSISYEVACSGMDMFGVICSENKVYSLMTVVWNLSGEKFSVERMKAFENDRLNSKYGVRKVRDHLFQYTEDERSYFFIAAISKGEGDFVTIMYEFGSISKLEQFKREMLSSLDNSQVIFL